MSLKSDIYDLLENSQRLCDNCYEADKLLEAIGDMKKRLDTPLRVAVVGIMKAGKSTFMNALMGANILYTGDLETTYTVSWFQYGDKPAITVHFRNGEKINVPFEDLKKWSVREYEKENPKINEVKYLIIYYPSEVLKKIEFIDTPGLNSVYGTDAQNTMDFLALKGSEDTLYEASNADAIIYAFNRTISEFDKDILDNFHKNGSAASSPINSIGILTKVDVGGVWDIFSGITPVEAALEISSTVMKNTNVKRLLFSVFPVCAKVSEGYSQLNEKDWEILINISKIDHNVLVDLLFDAKIFAECVEEEYEQIGNSVSRKRLINLIGQYGILEISKQLRSGVKREEICNVLRNKCGIQSVEEILINHFGNRTFLIKTQYILNNIRSVIRHIQKSNDISKQLLGICDQIIEGIDDLISTNQTIKELKALQMYYNGQVKFLSEDEENDFLHITGEYGRSPESRLGVQAESSIKMLEEISKKKLELWHGKAGGFMLSRDYVETANIMARSYEQMFYHLNALLEE